METINYLNNTKTIFKYYDEKYNTVVVEKHYQIYNRDVFECLKKKRFPNVPIIYELDEKEDELIVKEEYIEGENLQEYNEKYELSLDEIVDILKQICDILSPIHKNNIIHRDIKPANIIYQNNIVTLIDFNGAKLLDNNKQRDTILLGTQGYAAPEQYGFGPSTIETDIYGIGSLAEELTSELRENKLKDVIKKCHELNPNDRYKSVIELKKVLLSPKMTDKYNKHLPIGFRSKKLKNIIFATFGYSLLLFCTFTLQFKEGSDPNTNTLGIWPTRIIFLLDALFIIMFNHNYLGLRDKFKIKRNKNTLAFVIKLIVADYILAILFGVLLIIIFSILNIK